jgi:anti-sigma factor RsiW
LTDHQHSRQCQELLGQLSDYIDGELETAICDEIEQHLHSCHNCRVLVDTTKKTITLYQRHHRAAETELSPEVNSRLWQALRDAGYPANRDS